jgi:site-specific recombinase XerD
MQKELSEYKRLLKLKNYSSSTFNTYTYYFEMFLEYFKGHEIDKLTKSEVMDFLLKESEKGFSAAYQNQLVNSIKFYLKKSSAGKKNSTTCPRAKKPLQAPYSLQ